MDKHIVLPVKVLRDGDANRTELTQRVAQYSFIFFVIIVQYIINLLYYSFVLYIIYYIIIRGKSYFKNKITLIIMEVFFSGY